MLILDGCLHDSCRVVRLHDSGRSCIQSKFVGRSLDGQVDPDWGVLKSYRTHEDQLAKNMANLERLRRVMTTDLFADWPASYPQLATYEERMAWCEKEMRQRKDACKEYRKKGIIPSPGYVVFNQIDVT